MFTIGGIQAISETGQISSFHEQKIITSLSVNRTNYAVNLWLFFISKIIWLLKMEIESFLFVVLVIYDSIVLQSAHSLPFVPTYGLIYIIDASFLELAIKFNLYLILNYFVETQFWLHQAMRGWPSNWEDFVCKC